MALGNLYAYSEFTSDQDVTYKLSIYDSEYAAGTSYEFTSGVDGFSLTYKGNGDERYQPIKSSSVSFNMNVPSTSSPLYTIINNLQSSSQDRYKLKIERSINGGLVYADFWHGIIVSDIAEFADVSYPAFHQLTATDGLGLMKDIDFNRDVYDGTNGTLDGSYTMANIFSNMLRYYNPIVDFFGADDLFTTELCHWYEDTMPTPAEVQSPWDLAAAYPYAFTKIKRNNEGEVEEVNPISAYKVLEELLKAWGMRIWQQDGHWWVAHVGMWADLAGFSLWYRTRKQTGVIIASGEYAEGDFQKELGDIGDGYDITKLSGGVDSFLPEVRSVQAEYSNWENNGVYPPGDGMWGIQNLVSWTSNADMESNLIDFGYFVAGANNSFLLQDLIQGRLDASGTAVYPDRVSAVYMIKIGAYYWNGDEWTTTQSVFTSPLWNAWTLSGTYFNSFTPVGFAGSNFQQEMPAVPASGQLYYAVRKRETNAFFGDGGNDYDVRIWPAPPFQFLIDGETTSGRIFGAAQASTDANLVLDLGEILLGDGPTTSAPNWGRIRVSNGTTFQPTVQETWQAWQTGTTGRITQILVQECLAGQQEFTPLNNYNFILRNKAAFRFGDALDDNTRGGNRMLANGWTLTANTDQVSGEFFKASKDATGVNVTTDENGDSFAGGELGTEF